MDRSERRNRPSQRGAVAVIFILFSVLLLGFVAFAMDVARLYVSRAELQNAADSCALSAAAALTGTNPEQLRVAEDWGVTAGRRNFIGMQKAAPPMTGDNVTFSATLNGSYAARGSVAPEDALKMRFARCTLAEPDVSPLMIQVINLLPRTQVGKTTVKAMAVAGLTPSLSHCAIPLAVCTKDLADKKNFGYTVGEWLVGPFDTQDNINGKFKWVDFTGSDKTKTLKEYLDGAGYCNIAETQNIVPAQGAVATLDTNWNWRFGVMKASGPPAGAFPPDWVGFAYDASNWPSQRNVFDASKTGNFGSLDESSTPVPWNGVPSNLKGNWRDGEAAERQHGRRLVVGPFVNCAQWSDTKNNTPQPVLGWACYLMLNPVANPTKDVVGLEYRGPADDIASGCVTSGAPGGAGAAGPKVPTLVQ